MQTEEELLEQARETLATILTGLPGTKLEWDAYSRSDQPHLSKMADFTVNVSNGHHQHTLVVEIKNQGHPGQLRKAIDQLLRFSHRSNRPDYLVVAAPFITEEGAAVCQEENVGYYDLAGNCRLVFGNTYIERVGMRNTAKRVAPTPDLYAPRAERVLRILLENPLQPWKVAPLAKAANASLGTVSTVRKLLLEHEWVKETENGIALIRAERLLQDWAGVWARRRTTTHNYMTLDSANLIEDHLAEAARKFSSGFALTGLSAAWRYAPWVKYQRVQAYWGGDMEAFAAAANLRPADTGANVQLIVPRDAYVFHGVQKNSGAPIASPIQTYLDLRREPARGAEAAEFLWNKVLFPAHAAKQ